MLPRFPSDLAGHSSTLAACTHVGIVQRCARRRRAYRRHVANGRLVLGAAIVARMQRIVSLRRCAPARPAQPGIVVRFVRGELRGH